jgi:hypothetical protein
MMNISLLNMEENIIESLRDVCSQWITNNLMSSRDIHRNLKSDSTQNQAQWGGELMGLS